MHAALLEREAEHVEHAGRLIGERVDLAVRLRDGQKAKGAEIGERRADVEARERGLGEGRGAAVVARDTGAEIGQIAAAVAGGQQLAADATLPLKQRDLICGILRRAERGHHAARPAANDEHLHKSLRCAGFF